MKYSQTDLEAIREEIKNEGDNYSFDKRLDEFVKDYDFADEASLDAQFLSFKVQKYIQFQFEQWLAYTENWSAYCSGACTAETFSDPKFMLQGFAGWLQGAADNLEQWEFMEVTED
jgi:hypothetical protein